MPPPTHATSASPHVSTVPQVPQASVSEVNGMVSAMAIVPIDIKADHRYGFAGNNWYLLMELS